MNTLGKYMKDNDLSSEDMSKLISEKLGRSISAKGVEMQMKRSEAPIPWLNALDISPKEPNIPGRQQIPGQKSELEPSATNPLPFEPVSARATIELLYTMAGQGAAMASRTPAVAEAWKLQAPNLAEGWLEWAKVNRTVANGIALLTVGGPGGQVVLMNASLIITTLITINNNKALPFAPPKFDIYEGMSEDQIRQQTEQATDDALNNSPPPS